MVVTRAPGQAEHLDATPPRRRLDFHHLHLELLQSQMDREIISFVPIRPSGPPHISEVDRSWMNRDVSSSVPDQLRSPAFRDN